MCNCSAISLVVVVTCPLDGMRCSSARMSRWRLMTLYRYYKARFQIEFLFRDAKQFTGLSDCQARSASKLRFHFNASLSAVSCAKLEARQHADQTKAPFSMASLKRRCLQSTSA